jgi:alanine racemase
MEDVAGDGRAKGAGVISRALAGTCDRLRDFMLHALSCLPMPRPILATIDIAALRHNLAVARRHAGARKVWAVVKANAYGHGLGRALRGFADADGLALLDLDEAARAREGGWRKPVLLLEGFFTADDLPVIDELRLTPVIHHQAQIGMLAAFRPRAPIDVYVKVDTGMNRLGFAPADTAASLERLAALPGVRVIALMSHFANADRDDADAGPVAVSDQLRVFETACREWSGPRCLANSAALLLHPQVGGDAVRPGIALYGATPMAGRPAASFALKPAMSLVARVLSVRTLATAESIGYGSRWRAARPTRIGVLACGYADGYPRVAPDGTPVWIDGQRVPLVGRVSMDMITVDLTDAPQVDVGAEAELWGARIPVDEVAEACGTVGYELLCALARRVPVAERN